MCKINLDHYVSTEDELATEDAENEDEAGYRLHS